MRIVSLLPSATEIVCALGLGGQLVGVTHECDYPSFVSELPRITKTIVPHNACSRDIDSLVRERLKTQVALYTLDVAVLTGLEPDLLITQTLCDVCAVAEAEVAEFARNLPGCPRVLNLEPMSLMEVFETLRVVGAATGAEATAERVVRSLQDRVDRVKARTAGIPAGQRPRVAFLEWIDPPFNAGHWTPDLIELAGGTDVLGEAGRPSRTREWRDVVDCRPDVLFVACCGLSTERALQDMPFLTGQLDWSELPCARNGRVYLADGGAYFSRPGPRLVDSLEILAHALHPKVHSLPRGMVAARSLLDA